MSPSQPNPALMSADVFGEHGELSHPDPFAAAVEVLEKLDRTLESTHMQPTLFKGLISIRRPSAAGRRPSQHLESPAETLQISTHLCSTQSVAPSSERPQSIGTALGEIQGCPAQSDSSASAGQVGCPQQPIDPEACHDTSALTHSSTQLAQAAEPESHDFALGSAQEAMQEECETSAGKQADLAGGIVNGPCMAESGPYEAPAEALNATAEPFEKQASSAPSRKRVSHAALRISPSDACSLELACPSFVTRLAHPAWHAQRAAASSGTTCMQQVKKKPMLRGRNAEECGIRMYERARTAQHVRRTR